MPTFNPTSKLSSGPYAGDYNWNNGTNWTPVGVPGNGTSLTVSGTGASPSYTSVDDVNALSNEDLVLGNSVTLIVASGSTLGVTNFNSFGSAATFETDGTAIFSVAIGGTYVVKGLLSVGGINGVSTFTIDGGSASFGSNANISPGTSFNFNGIGASQLTILDSNDYINGWSYAVSNFTTLDRITLGTSLFVAGTYSSAYNPSAHTLTIPKAGGGNFVFNNFSLASGAPTSFLVTATSVESVCFAEGTRILTGQGEVAVEDLQEGDQVITVADGSQVQRPVTWIGRRRLDLFRHPQPLMAAPVRIRRSAFAENVPHRDLVVSPDHSIFVDNVLIPARLLVNGGSIVQELDRPSVSYFHIRLDRHAVLLSEGLQTESYLDTGNRSWFANAGADVLAHPMFEIDTKSECWERDACAPLAVDAATVEPVWRRLADRADARGYGRRAFATTPDADVRFEADGKPVAVILADRDRRLIALPPGTRTLRLVSRATAPDALQPWLDDRRTLGVCVRRIVLHEQAMVRRLAIDDPALASGWRDPEPTAEGMSRWTDGNAVIHLSEAASIVEIRLTTLGAYELEAAEPALRAIA